MNDGPDRKSLKLSNWNGLGKPYHCKGEFGVAIKRAEASSKSNLKLTPT